MRLKSTCSSYKDFPKDEINSCKISEGELVLGALDSRHPASCMTPSSCQLDDIMTNNQHGTTKI